jgi:hypothetical protein
MFVEAIVNTGDPLGHGSYDTCGTPCQKVVDEQIWVAVLNEVDLVYLGRKAAGDLGIQSYVGYPLLGKDGASIGVLTLQWRRAISRDEVDEVISTLTMLASRLSAEVEADILQYSLTTLIEGSNRAVKDDQSIFRSIVLQATAATNLKAAFLAECIEDDPRHFKVLSMAVGGAIQPDFESNILPYEVTPCRNLEQSPTFLLERGLQEKYSENERFVTLDLHSYFGRAFLGSDGKQIGHIVLLHDRPMSNRINSASLIGLVVDQAIQELQRYAATKKKAQLEETLAV